MFWPCYETRLIKMTPTIPRNLYVSFQLSSFYCGSRLIKGFPNPQYKEPNLKLTHIGSGVSLGLS